MNLWKEKEARFEWRGFMLDEARHFFGKEVVKKILDVMHFLKLNRFHWHLVDDQGWRIEIKKYPKLIEIGSKREASHIKGRIRCKTNNKPHGGYYTQKEIREIVDYAREREIEIVPEIELPGHCMSALAAYPNLSCTGGPFKVPVCFGIKRDVYCAGKEEVF
ncbi:MAG: family 20 glycosylhydrolase [Promethearchaeota archaeon]